MGPPARRKHPPGRGYSGQLYRAESRIRFVEPDAYLVIALSLGAMGLVYSFG